ncbi:MAG: AMP-binding protein [bacterium]
MATTKTSPFPGSLQSRDGWAEYLSARRTSEPHLHQIEPTNHCPYSCIMCPRSKLMTRKLGFMEMELFQKVMDEVAGYSEPVRSREIELFHFGESLLHPRIADMVAYASGLSLNVSLSVNAPHLTPEKAEMILASRPSRIIVSMDGTDSESYRTIRGPAADFTRATANIRHLAAAMKRQPAPTHVCLRMIRLKANEAHVDDFRRQWADLGFDVEIREFFPWTEKEMITLGEVEKYPPGMPCPFPWQYLVVQWDGTVVPCCRDYNGINALGNVHDSSLKSIWNGPAAAAIREQHRTGSYGSNELCKDCMAIFYTEAAGDSGRISEPGGGTLAALWREAVTRFGQNTLITDVADGSVFTYADADEVVRRTASRLAAAQLRKGDTIVVCSHQHTEAAFIFWAALQLGLVFVPLDPLLPETVVAGILAEVKPRLVFCDAKGSAAMPGGARHELIILDDAGGATADQATPSFSEWLGNAGPCQTGSAPAETDPAVILFTSGTSGKPKGVVLSHGSLRRSGSLVAGTYGWSATDVLFSPGDFHTMSGLRNPLVATLFAGASFLVAPHETRSNAIVLAGLIPEYRATVLATVPAMLRHLLQCGQRVDPQAMGSLRQVICTGSTLTAELNQQFRAAFRIPVYNYYGLTETAGICIGMRPGNDSDPQSIGSVLDRCAIRIIDSGGEDVADNQTGELLIHTPNVMTGYLNDPLRTAEAVRDGWYFTGDLARRDSGGDVFILGRRGDAIKDTRGELLHPAEIERVIETDPGVADAGVCGITLPGGEEQLAAGIVPSPGVGDPEALFHSIRRHILATLGPTRLPKQFFLLDALPRGTNSKLNRQRLAEIIGGERHHG